MENFRLRVFRAVARHLNFRMAAEELRLTQPAVTQQVKTLEAELGTALFDRAGGRVQLTAGGRALLPYAEELGRLAAEAKERVAAAAGETAGSLSVGASQTIGQYLLPKLIAGFLKENPRVQVSVTGGNTQAMVEELHARRVQVALIEGPALAGDLKVTAFMEDHMVCVVPAGHVWAGKEVELEAVRGAALLMREQGSGSRRIVEQALAKAGLPVRELTLGMTFDTTEGLLSGVEAGLGVGFVSRWAVRNQLALGTLKVARVRGLELGRMFSLAWLAGPEPAGTAGKFVEFVLMRAEGLAPRATGQGKAAGDGRMERR